jgi:hypothetical protein
MRLLLPTLCLLSTSLLAQYSPPIDTASILAGLKDLKAAHVSSSRSQLSQTISDFSNASANDSAALAFYLEAIRVTEFVGQPHEQNAFRDWKKREASNLSASAIRSCLRYTTISLQRSAGATDDQIFPLLLDYAQETNSMLSSVSGQKILDQPITGNVFAKWYNLGDRLGGLKDWEDKPGDVDGIYEKFLLPIMRRNRDERILKYWDQKIANETSAASESAAAFNTDRFNQTRRPSLLWSRAEDMIAISLRNQGITEMYSIIKSFPNHPDAGKWIDELQSLLTAPSSTGTQ